VEDSSSHPTHGEWLTQFDNYLRDVRGLRPGSRGVYARHVRAFLEGLDASGSDVFHLTVENVWTFIQIQSAKTQTRTMKTILPAVRSFLRYLAVRGVCDPVIVAGVPTVPRWRLADLPTVLSDQQISALLHAFDRNTGTGRRDYAIALCLVRLGLRCGEVAQLRLDDVDWRAGTLRLTMGKERRVSTLPLPGDVAAALVAYLQESESRTDDRHLFLQRGRAPHPGQALTSSAVRQIIRRAWARSGVEVPSRGTHALRHTLASHLLAAGADLKRIGDILRHRNLDTTAIYAKVDRKHLWEVVQAWPDQTQ